MTTEKQHQANIINAQQSTGPVTCEGKAIVSRNAVKHGIFARDLVITSGDGREEIEEYRHLLEELSVDLQPRGKMEQLLVEKIAVNYWRLRRLVRYENGEISSDLDGFKQKAISNYYDSKDYYAEKSERPAMEYYSYGDEISDTDYQAQKDRVTFLNSSSCKISDDRESLVFILSSRFDVDEDAIKDSDYKKAQKYIASLSPQQRGKLHRAIIAEAEQILNEMEEVRSWEAKFDLIARQKAVPVAADLDKIIKYENSLERSIFRNLAALKTLQSTHNHSGDHKCACSARAQEAAQ